MSVKRSKKGNVISDTNAFNLDYITAYFHPLRQMKRK